MWKLRGSELSRIYQSEDLISDGKIITVRPILCAWPASDSRIYFGDDGSSIKLLSWKTGNSNFERVSVLLKNNLFYYL